MEIRPPSAYVPLNRRFTNERDRELDETRALYASVKARQDAFEETPVTIGRRVCEEVLDGLPENVFDALVMVMYDLITAEAFMADVPPPTLDRMNLKEFVEYRNLLHAKEYFFQNQAAILDLFHEGLTRLLGGLADELPFTEQPSPFTIPLGYTLTSAGWTIDKVYGTLVDDKYADRGLFSGVADKLYRNLCKVSGKEPGKNTPKPFKNASDNPLPANELIESYLAGTPFAEFFETLVPLKLTHDDRFSHMHIVGGTGAGKTTLLENLILHDLRSPNPPSLVIVDPHGDLIKKLTHADLGLEDRLIIIDPRDVNFPPALNVFALNQDRLAGYDDATREQVTAGVIQTFDYLFTGLIGADLTAKQGVFFRYVARLMLSLPETMGRNATILDMIALMSDDTPYRDAISKLPDIPREFFMRDFASKTFVQTKEQIRYRLQAIIENPTLARLFTSPETKVDLFTEINRGAVILVDTAKDFLKGASSNFGRIFISLVLQAVLERAAQPAANRKDTFLIVDEAASYFDSNIDDLLTDARKYRCGVVLSHQYLDQASSSLRASLAANTRTKFASGLSASDARSMATEMRTTADFILNQPDLQFACHIRNNTPHAVSIPVEVGVFDKLPALTAAAYADLMSRNREKVSLSSPTGESRVSSKVAEPASTEPDEDISTEW